MKKSDILVMPAYFDRYINMNDDVTLKDSLENNGYNLILKERAMLEQLEDKVYAPDKWTIKDILQHIIDAERIFTYRALRFARNDKTPLPGFEENDYALEANAGSRTLDDIIHEFDVTRQSTIGMFSSFSKEQLLKTGISNNNEISVLAIGFTISGHLIHHMNIIKERYFPLL
ncbi:MAG TPA: DinB family protein [Saprospiraceae bacterium]|nr:DinB family protein [Saprospiraceae bacterium]